MSAAPNESNGPSDVDPNEEDAEYLHPLHGLRSGKPSNEADEPVVLDFTETDPASGPETTASPGETGKKRGGGPRCRRLEDTKAHSFKPLERLNLLDIWQRSGLAAGEFASLVGLSKHTLYSWKKKFEDEGPAGLEDKPRDSAKRQKLNDATRRAILMLKKAHPEYGIERISYLLARGPALAASPATVAKVLHEAGYQLSVEPTHKHRDMVRRFERAAPNQLWQTDLFTFVLKRQTTRVYLVAFMDDHSRFVVGYGLHASQSTALTLEVLRAAIAGYGRPEEILTDNGSQYVTWRGKGVFTKELEKRGIKQIVARPRHPQTLGKIERFYVEFQIMRTEPAARRPEERCTRPTRGQIALPAQHNGDDAGADSWEVVFDRSLLQRSPCSQSNSSGCPIVEFRRSSCLLPEARTFKRKWPQLPARHFALFILASAASDTLE